MKRALAVALCGITCAASITGCAFGKGNDESAEQIEKLEKKIDKLKDEVEELEGQIEYLEGENERLENENESLRDELLGSDSTAAAGSTGSNMSSYWNGGVMVYTDEYGNAIDLGGMEIVIRDWWSNPDSIYYPTNDYEEAQLEYYEWLEETYNFTVIRTAISDWSSTPDDYVDYVTTVGDDNNYIFVLRDDEVVTSAMQDGLMYPLSTLDCLDFSDSKYQLNMNYEAYSDELSAYSMAAGHKEPGIGVYFNKALLEEAGIDPDSIYEMQENGTWTWDAFQDLLNKSQRDMNGDGVTDIWGLAVNTANLTKAAVHSNGGQFVGKDNNGFTCEVSNARTVEALEWADEIFSQYIDDYSSWEGYKDAFTNGEAAFLVDYAYCGTEGNWLYDNLNRAGASYDIGFVAFPIGPKMNRGEYTNYSYINPVVIPACYDADRAWKLAFVWNVWNCPPPGYEDYHPEMSEYHGGIFDANAYETFFIMCHGRSAYDYSLMIPNLDVTVQLLWNISGAGNVQDVVEEVEDEWQDYIDEANR